MKTVLTMILAAMTISGSLASASQIFNLEKIPTETGDYCKDQALAELRDLFGQDVEIEKVFVEAGGETVNYWMTTNVCDGYLVAEFIHGASCTAAHYVSVPEYLLRMFSQGGCEAALPHDSVPTA